MGNEMFVLISGKPEVQVTVNGHSRLVRELNRGDVFGEMGLLRHHQRTGDVIAAEDVEVLVGTIRSGQNVEKKSFRFIGAIGVSPIGVRPLVATQFLD